jgi:methyl-accepting chemotaxis protein
VVADEVRSLAQGATKTARDIRGLVAQSREHASGGLEAVEELTKLLGSLDGHLQSLGEASANVGAAIGTGSAALERLDASAAAISVAATDALRLPARKQEADNDTIAPRAAGGRA